MNRRLLVLPVAAVLVASAAGAWAMTRDEDGHALAFDADVAAYDGPLDGPGRYGAAGAALECLHDEHVVGEDERTDVYTNGATADDPERAVDVAYSEGLFISAPEVALGTAARDENRELLTYEADGTVLMALLLRDGPASEGAGGAGWYVEAFARCDLSEFPAETARTGFGPYLTWTDGGGVPVPVAEVYSAPGPEHCDWQRMEFLHVGESGRRARSYVEAPERNLRPYVTARYREGIALPVDARDTGWEREGRHLWLSQDGRFAYVGSPDSVAAWPRLESGCI